MAPEIWAGIECSVVRVGDRIVDELALTGHLRRPGDLTRLAELGLRTVRYPALWERHPDALGGRFDWTSTDRSMATMERLGLRPALGLFHQGTGRRGEVLDPAFPEAFGAYAATVARRYPFVRMWLPLNEPMTTARFAGLYGHWYPHGHDDSVFTRLVLAQARAYRAAARELRAIQPDATILAAEDVGETFSTPELAGRAAFYRDRRWLVLDLLTGRFDRSHPLRPWLIAHGATASELDALSDVASEERPDVIGVHNYPTSDRFLDHRVERYPAWSHGGTATRPFADVEAVRVLGLERDGLREAVLAAWQRYGCPVAMTEVHIGGPAAQRRAWWWAAVRTADQLIEAGVDLRAVTAWSAFGSWEWSSLLTRSAGHYEPGLFDTRSRPPRRMAVARDVAAAAAGLRLQAPAVGWWTRADRLLYTAVDGEGRDVVMSGHEAAVPTPQRGSGQRARAVAAARPTRTPVGRGTLRPNQALVRGRGHPTGASAASAAAARASRAETHRGPV